MNTGLLDLGMTPVRNDCPPTTSSANRPRENPVDGGEQKCAGLIATREQQTRRRPSGLAARHSPAQALRHNERKKRCPKPSVPWCRPPSTLRHVRSSLIFSHTHTDDGTRDVQLCGRHDGDLHLPQHGRALTGRSRGETQAPCGGRLGQILLQVQQDAVRPALNHERRWVLERVTLHLCRAKADSLGQ